MRKYLKEQVNTNDPNRMLRQMRNFMFAIALTILGAATPMVLAYFSKINSNEKDNIKQTEDISNFKEDMKSVLDALDKQAQINANTNTEIKLLQNDVMYYKTELGEIKRIVLKTRGNKDVSTIISKNININ